MGEGWRGVWVRDGGVCGCVCEGGRVMFSCVCEFITNIQIQALL